jgi:hypothetical protein
MELTAILRTEWQENLDIEDSLRKMRATSARPEKPNENKWGEPRVQAED